MSHAFDVVQPRVPDGLGLYLKSRSTGRHYRIEPTRHPEQPRFWVLRVVRCQRPGVADSTFMPWMGSQSFSLSELPTELAAIKADIPAWVEADHHRGLRRWLDEGEISPMASLVASTAISESGRRQPEHRTSPPVVETSVLSDDVLAPAKSIEELAASELV